MRILLTESSPGSAVTLREVLGAHGCDVVTCTDDRDGPCRAIGSGQACPLDVPTDLALVARRPDETDTLFEMGAVCAERHRVPVAHIDPTVGRWTVADIVAEGAGGLDRAEAACAAVVRAALSSAMPGDAVTVEAHRTADGWQIQVGASDASSSSRGTVANRASSAVRAHDPFAKVIDVAIVRIDA